MYFLSKYYGDYHPLTGLLHLKLGKILVLQDRTDSALDHLKKAYEILSVTHGRHSSLFKEELRPLLEQFALSL